MFDTLKEDFSRYYELLPAHDGWWQRCVFFVGCQGMWAILDYRYRKWLAKRARLVRVLLRWPAFCMHVLIVTLTGISLPTGCEIGKGLYIGHFVGIFVHDGVVIGERCSLSHRRARRVGPARGRARARRPAGASRRYRGRRVERT